MSALEVIAGVLMAVGPPLAYADQVHRRLSLSPGSRSSLLLNSCFSCSLACNASFADLSPALAVRLDLQEA